MPKQHSSGGKHKLGSISKQGDRYLRSLFTAAANKWLQSRLTFSSHMHPPDQLPIGKGCLAAESGPNTYSTDKGQQARLALRVTSYQRDL